MVIPKFGGVGGAEGFAAELTGRIAADPRFEVHVFANRWAGSSGQITFHRVPIIRFPKFMAPSSFARFAARRIAAAGPFDLIHTHDRIFRADVYTLHGIPHRRWIRMVRGRRMSLFDCALARVEDRLVSEGGCRRFLAVSALTGKIFLEEYPVNPDLVTVVHPGIDPSLYAKMDRERCRRDVRGRFGIATDEILILFVSMNFAVKGLDHVIRGLARLRKGDPARRVRLLVVGRGDQGAYGRLAREEGLDGAVVFAGAVARETLPEFYLAGDLFVMPSRFDTFGMVVLEAMAAGLPVLISDTVGARDIVREGDNGFVVKSPADPDVIAEKIGMWLDGHVRERMRREALKTAAENSWDEAVPRVLKVYEEIWDGQSRVISKIPHP